MNTWHWEKAAPMARRIVWRLCLLPLRARLLQNPRTIERMLRGAAFREFIEKERKPFAPKAAVNPKEARRNYVPVGVLRAETANRIGAKSRVARLTDRTADKQWRRHGIATGEKHVPAKWYADIPLILQEASVRESKQSKQRWLFYHEVLKRRVVLGLDDESNPVLISYYGRKNE